MLWIVGSGLFILGTIVGMILTCLALRNRL